MSLPGKYITRNSTWLSTKGKEILCIWDSDGKEGVLLRSPFPPCVEPGGGTIVTPPLSTHHIWGSRISVVVFTDVSSPILSSGVRRLPQSVPQWRGRVGSIDGNYLFSITTK